MLRFTILCTAAVAYVMAASTTMQMASTTHRPHGHHGHPNTTREPTEHDVFKFLYEPHTHMMVIVNGHTCYMFMLSDAEQVAVHTDAGIKALELKLLGLLTTGTRTSVTMDSLSHTLQKACGAHATQYYNVM